MMASSDHHPLLTTPQTEMHQPHTSPKIKFLTHIYKFVIVWQHPGLRDPVRIEASLDY